MLSGKAAKCIFTFPELHFYSFLFYRILWTLVQYERVKFDHVFHLIEKYMYCGGICVGAQRAVDFFSIWDECRSQKSQLFTQTIGSGGDRFGKLFELMDQVSFQDYSNWLATSDLTEIILPEPFGFRSVSVIVDVLCIIQ